MARYGMPRKKSPTVVDMVAHSPDVLLQSATSEPVRTWVPTRYDLRNADGDVLCTITRRVSYYDSDTTWEIAFGSEVTNSDCSSLEEAQSLAIAEADRRRALYS